ncbi:MAG: sugar transferase [Candidatus Magasanikbacteria bacterium]|nr:sugar transferase [Candidatus Magasanikbacteria bacterium]
MKRSEVILLLLQVPIDFLMLFFAGVSAYYLRFSDWATTLKPVFFDISIGEFISIVSWVALGWLVIFAIVGLYSTDPNRKLARDLVRVILACSTGLAAVAVYVMFTQEVFDSRFLVVASWACAIMYVSFGRLVMRGVKGLMYRFGMGLRRVVVIGNGEIGQAIIETLNRRKELGYAVVGSFDSYTKMYDTKMCELRIDELFFSKPRSNEAEALSAIRFCNAHHIVFKYSADLFATYSANMTVTALAGIPIVELTRTPLDGWGRIIKRIFDIVVSIFVLIILSPLWLLLALVIFIETGSPVIYKNKRIGIRGNIFFTLKFRSMYQDKSTGPQFGEAGKQAEAEEQKLIEKQNSKTGPIYKIADDPRVTPFGRFIRRWSIDELPQFINVIRGEMSIVGPRPHQPREVEKYEQDFPLVFVLKPGITGLAQISGRSDLSFEEEMRLDILYVEKWSLLQDIIIFLKTPFILFKRRKVL